MTVFELQATLGLDTSEYEQGIANAKKEASGIGNYFSSQFKEIFAGSFLADMVQKPLVAMYNGIKEGIGKSISLASDLAEVQNVVDVTFGDGAGKIEIWSKKAKNAFGMGELSAKKFAGTMGAMLKSMGMTDAEVLDMSTSLVQLAGDMASFYNLDHETAFEKIRAGISGETEPLKQLGINMSVANLEAYALSQGIDKTYSSMTQAEQATLRYNYILSATAGAQGDFARTSGEYANQIRLFEQNVQQILSTVGDAMLDIVTPALKEMNDLLQQASEQTMGAKLGQIDMQEGKEIAEAEIKRSRAHQLIDVIEELGEETELTDEESRLWQRTIKELIALFPELAKYIDAETGKIITNTDELRKNTDEFTKNSKEKAKVAALKAKEELMAQSLAQATTVELHYDIAEKNLSTIGNAIGLAYGASTENAVSMFEKDFEKGGYNLFDRFTSKLYIDSAKSVFPEGFLDAQELALFDHENFEKYMKAKYGAFPTGVYDPYEIAYSMGINPETEKYKHYLFGDNFGENWSTLAVLYSLAEKAQKEIGKDLSIATSDAEMAENAYYSASETIAQMGIDTEALAVGTDGLTASQTAYNEALDNAAKEFENVEKEWESVKKYREDVYKEMHDSLKNGTDDLWGLVADMTKADIAGSGEVVKQNMLANEKFYAEYAANLRKAKEKGVDANLLNELAQEHSAENAALLKYIVGGGDVSELNAAWETLQTTKSELSDVMAEAALEVDDAYKAMEESAKKAVESFEAAEMARQNAATTAEGVVQGLESKIPDIEAKVEQINQIMNSLGLGGLFWEGGEDSVGGFSIGLGGGVTGAIESAMYNGAFGGIRAGLAGQKVGVDLGGMLPNINAGLMGLTVAGRYG